MKNNRKSNKKSSRYVLFIVLVTVFAVLSGCTGNNSEALTTSMETTTNAEVLMSDAVENEESTITSTTTAETETETETETEPELEPDYISRVSNEDYFIGVDTSYARPVCVFMYSEEQEENHVKSDYLDWAISVDGTWLCYTMDRTQGIIADEDFFTLFALRTDRSMRTSFSRSQYGVEGTPVFEKDENGQIHLMNGFTDFVLAYNEYGYPMLLPAE